MPEIKIDHSSSPKTGLECASVFISGIHRSNEYSSDIPEFATNKSQKDRYQKLSKIFRDLKSLINENSDRKIKLITAFLVKYTSRIPSKEEIELMQEEINKFESIKEFYIPLELSVKDSVKFICDTITHHLDKDLNNSEALQPKVILKPNKKDILRRSMANVSMPDLQTLKIPSINTDLASNSNGIKRRFKIVSNLKMSKLKDLRRDVMQSINDFAFSPLPSIKPMRGAESPKELSKFKVVRQSVDMS